MPILDLRASRLATTLRPHDWLEGHVDEALPENGTCHTSPREAQAIAVRANGADGSISRQRSRSWAFRLRSRLGANTTFRWKFWLTGPTLADQVVGKLGVLVQAERFGQARDVEQSQDLARWPPKPYPALDQGRGSQ